MESMGYVIACAITLFNFLGIVAGLVLVYLGMREIFPGRRSAARQPAGSRAAWRSLVVVAVVLIGGLVIVLCSRPILTLAPSAYRASQPSLCQDLPLSEKYSILVVQQADRAWGYLEAAQSSAILIPYIVEYAVEGDRLLGKEPSTWFWFNLSTGEMRKGLSEARYRAELQRLGFAREPTLAPIQSLCGMQRRSPRPSRTPEFGDP